MKKLLERLKRSFRKAVNVAAYFLWRKFNGHPRIMRLMYFVNDRLHLAGSRAEARQLYASVAGAGGGTARDALALRAPKPIREIRIAAVLDEFSYNCFKYECNVLPIEPTNWKDIFEREQPDLFLCESAWAGADAARRPWGAQVYASSRFMRENRDALLSILAYCRDHRIPTAFWNKEDPAHFDDKAHNFVDTAVRFDTVFTTDEDCVSRYEREYGHRDVHTLMFAAQPRLFNPVEEFERTDDVVFAGGWYSYHEARCREMEGIFDKIVASGRRLVIYDRYSGGSDPNHVFPEKYREYVRPALPYAELARAYKGSRYALNINTVTASPTMFARRVFELMCSNTFVLTNRSKGVEALFGDNVLYTDDRIEFTDIERKCEENLYRVLSEHTYANRLRQLLDAVGVRYLLEDRSIALCYIAEDEAGIAAAIEACNRVLYAHKRCMVFLSERILPASIGALYMKYRSDGVEIHSARHIRDYSGMPRVASPYFIFPGEGMKAAFPARAVLHFAYLDADCSVHEAAGRQYMLEPVADLKSRLFPGKHFSRAAEALLFGREFSLPSYGI